MIDKVLVLSQRNSQVWKHMSADVAHGFRRLGLDVQFIEELHKHTPVERLWQEIVACQVEDPPQLIFVMGHLRSAYPHGMWNGDAVFATWVQDWVAWTLGKDPEQARMVEAFNSSKDLIFYSFPSLGKSIIDQGFDSDRVRFLPPGANMDRFYAKSLPDGPFTIGYPNNVGAPMTAQDPVRLRKRLDPVEWLLEMGVPLKLWGQGWDMMENTKPHWHGLVKNGPELRRAYQSCHAILHANTDLVLYHQRVYEALACGRRVLCYGKLEYPMGGVIGFNNKKELESAVEWAKNAGEPTLSAENDYVARCRSILNAVPTM